MRILHRDHHILHALKERHWPEVAFVSYIKCKKHLTGPNAKICPRCRATFESPDADFCTVDGTRLVTEEELETQQIQALIGREVAGRYRVLSLIGGGGMGTVYKAVQKSVERVVALKVLKRELCDDRVAVERFRREARAASLLSSPYTVTLHEFGEDKDGTLFLAMELLEGQPLSVLVAERGAMPWKKALALARQVVESLVEAHEKGIVHRDLKPENIFITRGADDRLRAKVVDFGIAILTQTSEQGKDVGLTRTGMIVGTPGYMSPEQAKGQRADARSDFYSLGVILYELLTGKPPFVASEAVLVMGQHISAPVPPMVNRTTAEAIPPAVELLVLEMLAKKPSERVQTAKELHKKMSALLGGKLDVAPEDLERLRERTERMTDPGSLAPKRSRVIWAAVAAIVAFMGGLGGVAFTMRGGSAATTEVQDAAPQIRYVTKEAGPSSVWLRVKASPAEARFKLDDKQLEGNPYRGEFERSTDEHLLVIESDGYISEQRKIRFGADLEISTNLQKVPEEDASLPEKPPGKRGPRFGKVVGKVPADEPEVTPPPVKRGGKTRPPGGGLQIDTSWPPR